MGNGTSIGRVRGLGSAKSGARTWIAERGTGMATLVVWAYFVVSMLLLPSFGYNTVHDWMSRPLSATAMVLLVIGTFWHTQLGLRVVIEDYVHTEANKIACLIALNGAVWGGAAFGVISIIRIALGGA